VVEFDGGDLPAEHREPQPHSYTPRTIDSRSGSMLIRE